MFCFQSFHLKKPPSFQFLSNSNQDSTSEEAITSEEDDEDDEEEDANSKKHKNKQHHYHQWILQLVGEIEPLLGGGGMVVEEAGETVGVALVHPSSSVRLVALKRVREMVKRVVKEGGKKQGEEEEDEEGEEDGEGWKKGLSRLLGIVGGLLEDEDEEVGEKALSLLCYVSSFPLGVELLGGGGGRVSEGVWRVLREGRKGKEKKTISLCKLALQLRSGGELLAEEKEEKCWWFIELLFDCLLVRKGGLELATLALEHIQSSSSLSRHPLFSHLPLSSLLSSLSSLKKAKKESIEAKVGLCEKIVGGVAEGVVESKSEEEFESCLKVLGYLAAGEERGGARKESFFHSLLFGFFVLNRCCELFSSKLTSGSKKKGGKGEEGSLSHSLCGRLLRVCLVLLSHSFSLFAPSLLSKMLSFEGATPYQEKVSENEGLAGVLELVCFFKEKKKGALKPKTFSFLLLLSLNTLLASLPKDSSSLVLPCHLLFDLQTSLDVLRKEKENDKDKEQQRRVVLLSTLSTLYLFMLSPPLSPQASPLSLFFPQIQSLISLHLSQKFLSFSSIFYTAPTRPVFLTQSSVTTSPMEEEDSSANGDWGLFELGEGAWMGNPGVQMRALNQVIYMFVVCVVCVMCVCVCVCGMCLVVCSVCVCFNNHVIPPYAG